MGGYVEDWGGPEDGHRPQCWYSYSRVSKQRWDEIFGQNSGSDSSKGRKQARPTQKFKDALRQAPYPVDD
jgi:hypothetical protein